MTLNRREFLHRIGLALGAGVAGRGALELVLPDGVPGGLPFAEALTSTLPAGKPILVMIELSGGNDILNTIVPMNVAGTTGYYRTARPNLGITQVLGTRPYAAPAAGGNYLPPALDLDGAWALHGSLWWLANRWWTKGDVAIVQGAGENVAKEMSHFGAMAYRWAAAFTGPNLATGWLGRYNDVVAPGVPLGGVALATASQSLAGNSPAVVIGDIPSFGWSVQNVPSGSQWLADFQAMGDRTLPTSLNKVAVAGTALANANDAIAQVKGIAPSASGGGGGQLGNQLATAAALILGGVPCQTYVAGFSGWDTHGGEPYNHFVQLQTLNDALARFFGIIDASSRANDVFVLITSEFGRQVSQNAGGGTDHGRASSNILVGGGVKGGLYGAFPDLAPAARSFDAMVPTVDFRSVFATVLNRLGGDPNLTEAVLGRNESNASFGDLGVFTTGPTNPPPSTTTTVPGQTTTTTKVDGTTTVPMSTSTTMPMSSTTTTMPKSTTTTTTTTKVEPTTTTMATTTTVKPTTTTSWTTTSRPRRR